MSIQPVTDFMTRSELHVVLYSPSQGTLHIESITKCVKSNINSLSRWKSGTSSDWIVVGVGASLEEAIAVSEKIDQVRHEWPGYGLFTGGDMRPLAEIASSEADQ